MPLIIPIQDAPLLETTIGAVFAGATEMSADLTIIPATSSAIFAGSTQITATLTVVEPEESSITIFVDILDSAIIAAQNSNQRRYTSMLLVDGIEVPIKQATLEARKDSLGTELRVTLAIADRDQVTFTSSITFQIGIWTTAWQWIPLIEGGRLSSIDNPIRNDQGRPADEVSLSIVDVIADRWNRAPRAPIHLYDPLEVSAPEQSQIAANRIELQTGGAILPVNTPIAGMKLRDVLNAAYVTGTGFSSVVTNIPDFPVTEADFTLDGGFDAGVRPLLSLFNPLFFERNNVLFIIDPDGPLPAGFTARAFPQSLTRELTDSTPQREPVNALLLRLKGGVAGEYSTERVDSDPPTTSGDSGQPNWTSTTIERRIREWRNFAAPLIIVREENVSETTTVRAIDPVDMFTRVVEETLLTQTFDTLGRKTGHARRVSKRLPDLNNNGTITLLPDVTRQDQLISYRPNPLNPAEDVQDVVATVESGLIVVDQGNQYLGNAYKIPLTDAHVSGYIDPSGSQSVITGDIRTTTEALRVRGQQVDVEVRTVNHISNASTSSISTRPGIISMNRKQGSGTRMLLITVPGTDALGRRAQTFDASSLPSDIAIELAERKLRRLNDPPRQIALSPAYVDISIKRGTLLAIEARGVVIGNYIAEGFSISFAAFSQERGADVSMSVTAREVRD